MSEIGADGLSLTPERVAAVARDKATLRKQENESNKLQMSTFLTSGSVSLSMSGSAESFSETIRRILTDYPVDQIGAGISSHTVREDIERRLPEMIRGVMESDELVIKSSAGKGRWTAIPWVAVMDSRETDRIQEGIYVVYLFEPQENRVSLTLNQGVTALKNAQGTTTARQRLQDTAAEVRSEIDLEGFSPGPLEFPHASSRNELYGPGTILYKHYSIDAIPDEAEAKQDLETLVAAYRNYVEEQENGSRALTSDYWRNVKERKRRAEVFFSDPTEENFEEWLATFSWYVSRYRANTINSLFRETSPENVGATLKEAAETRNIEDVLKLSGFGISAASEALATLAPDTFAILNKDAANTLEALQFDPPNPDTSSPARYREFLEMVEEMIRRYPLRDRVDTVPDWATDVEVANYVFHLHGEGDLTLGEFSTPEIQESDESSSVDRSTSEDDSRETTDRTFEPLSQPPRRGETIARQLATTKQLVFYGPPGTGKTYTAQRFARWWITERTSGAPDPTQLELVTFHPSFAYEDFIEGLTAEAQEGAVEYRVEDGVFKTICERARTAYGATEADETAPPYVLIIDEINRGNLAQIFGETMTLLEADKRLDGESEATVTLAHSGTQFTVPPNLFVIGTMNTADRSIALVDAALRRRFRFLAFPPEPAVLHEVYGFDGDTAVRSAATNGESAYRQLLALSISAVETLNESILEAPDLGRGQQIGHSYLLGFEEYPPSDRVQAIVDAWRFEILPLLEEYYFGQFDRIRRDLFDGDGELLFDWNREQIRAFSPQELAESLTALTGIDTEVSIEENDHTESTSSTSSRPSWDLEKFMETVREEQSPERAELYEDLRQFVLDEGGNVDWGTGKTGAMQFKWDEYNDGKYLVFELLTDGRIQFRFWGDHDGTQPAFQRFAEDIDRFVDESVDPDHLTSEDFTRLSIPIEKIDDEESLQAFENTIRRFVSEYEELSQ